MTYFAAISKFQDKEFKIVGSSVSKSACSRIANKKVTNAREYVNLINN